MIRPLLLVALFGCQTAQQASMALSDDVVLKKTMPIKVNGKAGVGAMTVPPADVYKLEFDFPAPPENLRIGTCHRDVEPDNPKTKVFLLPAVRSLENKGACTITVDALDTGGVNSSAVIEIEDEQLEASVICNGETRRTKGANICQSREGLIQRILFFEPVTYKKLEESCADLIPVDGLIGYDFNISKGDCIYIFRGDKAGFKHRLLTIGYTDTFLKNIKPKNQ